MSAGPVDDAPLDITAAYTESNIGAIVDQLDRELIGLASVMSRIRVFSRHDHFAIQIDDIRKDRVFAS
jgi:hypothetical protein